ncbi:restriction endonuclease [Planktothrix paucivesiculata]|uniref:Mrr restriction system protein-like protein n=1 Tax=Planktothrix paucivesiculata PCC 9631 TaxID=671071 RepID=A0A7Z9C339_9CYAN|nr:restriction endonuclease [Planktothrix paucivesiculata]VXD24639.1 Mrr restriction system protein-like protein [Planktothrix paucivesiculata PCC 9631]
MNQSLNIPSHSHLFDPTIKALESLGGSGTVQEIHDKVCQLQSLSEPQQSILHKQGPQTEIAYRLGWVRTYLKVSGVLESVGRGVWSLTEKGRNLQVINPKEINRFVNQTTRKKTEKIIIESVQDFNLLIQPTIETIESISDQDQIPVSSDIWIEKLLEILQQISPDSFERLCQRILRESGFIKVEVTGRKGDGGIDGIGVLKIALLSFQVFFQCKRYKGSVGPSEIRDFRGAMVGRTDKGLFLTTGTFTSSAKQEATRDGAPVLDLIDGEQLCQILKDLSLGVETKMIEVVEIDHNWFNHL